MCAAKTRRAKVSLNCYPCSSAKELSHKGYAFLSIQKANALAVSIVRGLSTREAPPPVLASASARASAPGSQDKDERGPLFLVRERRSVLQRPISQFGGILSPFPRRSPGKNPDFETAGFRPLGGDLGEAGVHDDAGFFLKGFQESLDNIPLNPAVERLVMVLMGAPQDVADAL